LLTPDSCVLRRNIGLAGFSFRPKEKLVFNGSVERASSDRTYFRTTLNDYQKAHVRGRYQALGSLSFSADLTLLNNQNPASSVRYDYLARQSSISTQWSPQGGKRFTVLGDYTRYTVRS